MKVKVKSRTVLCFGCQENVRPPGSHLYGIRMSMTTVVLVGWHSVKRFAAIYLGPFSMRLVTTQITAVKKNIQGLACRK